MSIKLMTVAWDLPIPFGPKLVLLALCDNANDQGECYPAIPTISKKCSMSERSVYSHIDFLEENKILYRENRAGRSSIYHIDPCKFCTPANSAPTPAKIADTPAKFAPRIITESSKNLKTLSSGAKAPEKSVPDDELQTACKATWESYKAAYSKQYGIDPLRSASVNANIRAFCKRVPRDEAPHIAAFFLTLKDSYYVQMSHAISVMLTNAEGLRMRWATGRKKIATKKEPFDGFAFVNQNAINPGERIEKPIN